MKRIQMILDLDDDRCSDPKEEALLIGPDIAAVAEGRSIAFFRVKASEAGGDPYEECGYLFELRIPARSLAEIGDMPPETAAFAGWVKARLEQIQANP